MKTKTMRSLFRVSMFLAGLGMATNLAARDIRSAQPTARANSEQALANPQTFVAESLGSAIAADVYLVSCTAECIRADINDAGPFNDTRFKIEINGSTPGFVGNASAFNRAGDFSNIVEVCSGQNVNRTRRAYVTVSEVNAAGDENYDTFITCRTAGGAIINPSIVKILDQ